MVRRAQVGVGMPNSTMKRRILEFISEYSHANSVAPTLREIGVAVGLNSPSSVSRYIEQLKNEGKVAPLNQRSRAIALARRIELHAAGSQPQRVCLEVADGGMVLFDCNLEKKKKGITSVAFSGILDASQIRGRVSQVVSCRIEKSW